MVSQFVRWPWTSATRSSFFYRKDTDASSSRQKCERWGVVCHFEPIDPAAPVPPVNPIAPNP
jgi:hypothetical protein